MSENSANGSKITVLEISRIRMDGGTQPRARLSDELVEEYVIAMRPDPFKKPEVFPPVIVFYDGVNYWLADGFHRVKARIRIGFTDIEADIRQGTQRDAILYAAGANAKHGLQRSPDDKRKAVNMLLADPEWGGKSDSWIADIAKVSHTFVGKCRKLWEARPTCNDAS